MRRFLAPSIPGPGEDIILPPDVSRHLLRVTKVRRGAQVALFDAEGRSAVATLVDGHGGVATVRIDTVQEAPVDVAPLIACLAVTKGSRFELSVRMAVELGATEVWPVLAKRSVAKGDRGARWARVIEGAVGQSGRVGVPVLHPLTPLPVLLRDARWETAPVRWICVPGAVPVMGSAGPAGVLIGPEGGWTDAEVAEAVGAGWCAAGLGDHVLRAETAVASALTRVRCAGPASR